MKKILLVLIGISVTIFANMSRNTMGIVTDDVANLEWQDDYSDNNNEIKIATWQKSIEYCESLNLDGTNWRLPNINELLSIVDYTHNNPSINTDIFKNTTLSYYWSSTTNAYNSQYSWSVNFAHGSTGFGVKSPNIAGLPIRCVRVGQQILQP